MSTTAAEKAALRRTIRAAQSALTPDARARSDGQLFERFLALPEVTQAESILLFYGMKAEPDTARLIAPLLSMGKTVSLPRCLVNSGMEARRVTADSVLVRHPYGMLEPGKDCPLVEREKLDLILVPGLCYDKFCYRLGQGGGYYDRYLSGYRGVTVGLCRAAFLQSDVPREPHDRRVDLVLTETEALFTVPCLSQNRPARSGPSRARPAVKPF